MKGIRLRPVNTSLDTETLYGFMTDGELPLFSDPVPVNDMKCFGRWLHEKLNGVFHDFMIIELDDGRAVGFTHDFDFRLSDGCCRITTYVQPKYRPAGVGAAASLLFIDRLFRTWPLRKIYTAVFDYNRESITANVQGGFIQEGRLREYRYFGGAFHDLLLFSVSRDSFYELYGGLLESEPMD